MQETLNIKAAEALALQNKNRELSKSYNIEAQHVNKKMKGLLRSYPPRYSRY